MKALTTVSFLVAVILAGCSIPFRKADLGAGSLPGDVAVPSSNGVTSYECDQILVRGKKFEFTLDAGSPVDNSFAGRMCSCLRAADVQSDAAEAFNQIERHGMNSWGAKGALAVVGANIMRCQRSMA
jgi:hypothetical protein